MPTATEDISAEDLEARARRAEHDAAELERKHLDGEEDVDLAAIDAAREDARKLRWQAKAARHREAAREAAERDEALAALGSDIRAAADRTSTEGLTSRLEQLARDVAELRQVVADYNRGVSVLGARARALGAVGHAPSGPRPDCGRIALTHDGVQAGETELRHLGDISGLIAAAVSGEPVNVPPVVVTHTPPVRPPHAIRGRGGVVHALERIDENHRSRIDTGDVIELTGDELAAWWDGVLDVGSIDQAARGAEQVAAAKAREKSRWEAIHADQHERIEANEQAARARKAGRPA